MQIFIHLKTLFDFSRAIELLSNTQSLAKDIERIHAVREALCFAIENVLIMTKFMGSIRIRVGHCVICFQIMLE